MSEEIPHPERKPTTRRTIMMASVLALLAGLGLFGQQVGFIVWDFQPMDLGFTQVAQAGALSGRSALVAEPDLEIGAATELLRPGRTDADKMPVADHPASPSGREYSVRKSDLPEAMPPANGNASTKVELRDSDESRGLPDEIDSRDRAVDLCSEGAGGSAGDCSDIRDDVRDEDDDLEEISLVAALDDLPDADDAGEVDHDDVQDDAHDDGDKDERECADRDRERDRDRYHHRGGGKDRD